MRPTTRLIYPIVFVLILGWTQKLVAEDDSEDGDQDSRRTYLPVKSSPKKRRLVASAARRNNSLPEGSYATLEDREKSDDIWSKFSLGLFLSQNVFVQSNTSMDGMHSTGGMSNGSMGGMGSMPGSSSQMGGMMGSSNQMSLTQAMNTAMSNAFTGNVKAGYKLSTVSSLTLSVLGDFQDGLGDPTAGVSFHFFLVPDLIGQLNFEIAAPLSKTSQDTGRITTLIWSAGPTYMKDGFLVGLVAYGAYAFYRQDSMGSMGMHSSMGGQGVGGMMASSRGATGSPGQSMPMNTSSMGNMGMMNMGRETMEHGGTAYLGYPIWKGLRGLSSAGLSASYYENSNISWGTDATLLRLTYVTGGFAPSVAFSFLSDMNNNQAVSIPNQPFFGFRMEYVFGDRMSLGGSDSCTMMR